MLLIRTAGNMAFGNLVAGVLFVGAAVLYLAASYLDRPVAALILKPVPVLVLAWLALGSMGGALKGRVGWLLAGLLFSALGDTIQALPAALGADATAPFDGATMFKAGLGAFFVAHLCYVIWFLSLDRSLQILRLIGPVVYIAIFLILIWPNLGELLIPVVAYSVLITVMLWRALAVAGGSGFGMLAAAAAWGAVMFVVADTLIAINRFVQPIPLEPLATMVTYWIGQLGIYLSSREA